MNKTGKNLLLFFCCMGLAVGCNMQAPTSIKFSPAEHNYTRQLKISGKFLQVEVANTATTMAQGLSDRTGMEQDQGMLFNFVPSGSSTQGTYPSFWMKGMKFNLDFIWIYKNKIVGITADVPAPADRLISRSVDELPNYFPPSPVTWVLEVNAGWAKKNNISVGDVAVLK